MGDEGTVQPESVPGFRLSPQQERLWLLTGGRIPSSRCTVELVGPLDEARLRGAVDALVARHEILRTTFVRSAGMRLPSQVVHDRLPPAWERADEWGGADEAPEWPDIASGPALRALLLAPEAERRLLVLSLPSLCADPRSLLVLVEDLRVLYEDGTGATLSEPIQYADYAEWRHELLAADEESAQVGRRHWEEAPGPELPPLMFGRTPGPGSGAALLSLPVPLAGSAPRAVVEAAAARGAGLPLFLEACWHALLGRLTGAGEVAVGGDVEGRHHPELLGAVGLFAQPVPISSRIEGETTFAEVLEQVRRSRAEAERHQDFRPSEADAPSLGFSAVEVELSPKLGAAELVLRALRAPAAAQLLSLSCRVRPEGVEAELEYDPAAYDRDDVERVATSLQALVRHAAANPESPVVELPLLDGAERSRLVLDRNRTEAQVPDRCIHELFVDQARRTPERAAVVAGPTELTYAELAARAARIAHRLRSLGVARNSPVGLCLDRSCEMVGALLGILEAGGAYLPLNYEHPPARLAAQLEQAGATVVVTKQGLADRFEGFEGSLLCLDREAAELEELPADPPDSGSEPGDLVYVMYTSGSTGVPKGAAVTHRNLASYTAFMIDRLGAAERGVVFATVTAISTDLGNTCVFPSLLSGGTLHLVDPETAMQGALFADYVEHNTIDVLKITPSHLRALLSAAPASGILPRSWLVLGGEALPWELADQVREQGDCRVLNHYGPTETTVGCLTYEVVGPRTDAATVPVGHPIAAARVYVLDERLEPLPVGVAGELFIAGAGVSDGYAGQPEQTAERFLADPFSPEPGARMYRTGDRARVLRDDAIEFLGRIDDQVKIRGYRVEPREVEVVLARLDDVRHAAVAVDAGGGEPCLVAYVVGGPAPDELRAHLQEFLPEYMVPAEIVPLDRLPLTSSGKVDRIMLASGELLATAREASYVAPQDELEQELASLWAEALGLDRVGVEDDFFALGGHSLMATQVIARLRRAHGIEVPFQALFDTPTVSGLAASIRELRTAAADEEGLESVLAELGVSAEEARMLLTEEEAER